jgi:uncharacterized membrane protein YciS (DUF1049 family)
MIWLILIPLTIIAVFITAAALSDILTGNYLIQEEPGSEKTTLGILIAMGLCAGILPAVFAALLIRRLMKIRRLEKQKSDAVLHDSVLELAKKMGGKLTVIETTTELNMSLSDANTILNQFISYGLARLQVSESGVLVYYFDQIISNEEKNRAETV